MANRDWRHGSLTDVASAVCVASTLLAACTPQVIDAVDAIPDAGASMDEPDASGGGPNGSAGAPDGPPSDRDGDGTPDAVDGCPDQPAKTAPGLCGCDLPDDDTSEPGVASCRGLIDALVHRYAFDGSGTVVRDSLGGASGAVVNATLTGSGAVSLAGHMTDQYVDLPNGLISSLESVTLEAWLTWYGGPEWQRIFDFGNDQTGVEGSQGSGSTYLFLTPRITDDGGRLVRAAYQRTSYPEVQLDATRTLPSGTLTHVAVTFDAATKTFALYIDGGLEKAQVVELVPMQLSAIDDINDWLGRSQYSADPQLGATIEEFRIYGVALSTAQIHTSFSAGPNPSFLPE
jgi:hypothetical protein